MRVALTLMAVAVACVVLSDDAFASRQSQSVAPGSPPFTVPGSGGVVVTNTDADPETPGNQGEPVLVSWENPTEPASDIEVEIDDNGNVEVVIPAENEDVDVEINGRDNTVVVDPDEATDPDEGGDEDPEVNINGPQGDNNDVTVNGNDTDVTYRAGTEGNNAVVNGNDNTSSNQGDRTGGNANTTTFNGTNNRAR